MRGSARSKHQLITRRLRHFENANWYPKLGLLSHANRWYNNGLMIWQTYGEKWLWPSLAIGILLWGLLNEGAEKQIDAALFASLSAGMLALAMVNNNNRTHLNRLRGWKWAATGLGLVVLVLVLQFTPFPLNHGGEQTWTRPDMATVDPDNTFRALISLSSAVAFFIFGALFAVDRNRRGVVIALIGVALIIILLHAAVAYNLALQPDDDVAKNMAAKSGLRMSGTFISANAFASLLLLAFGLLVAVIGAEMRSFGGKGRHWVRVCSAMLIIATLICLYQTQSRTALILASATAFLFALLLLPKSRRTILAVGVVGLVALIFVGTYADQLGIPMRDFNFAGSYVGRAAEWDTAWRLTEMRPLLGWGAGTYAWISEPLQNAPLVDVGLTVGTPYNFLLLITSETGLLGLIAWSVLGLGLARFVVIGMQAGQRRGILAAGFALACGMILVHNFTDFSLSLAAFSAVWSFVLGYAGGLGSHKSRSTLTKVERRPLRP